MELSNGVRSGALVENEFVAFYLLQNPFVVEKYYVCIDNYFDANATIIRVG